MKPQTVFIQLIGLVVFLVIVATCADTPLSTNGHEKNMGVDSTAVGGAATERKDTTSAAPPIEKISMRAAAGTTSSTPGQMSSGSGSSAEQGTPENEASQSVDAQIQTAQLESESNLSEVLGESSEEKSDMSVHELSERADSLYEKQKSILDDILEGS